MLSTITFIIAYYPQVRLNYLVKDTDVALGLILSWAFADTLSYIGMFLQNALQSQIVLQTYFTVIVYLLLIQYLIYKKCKGKFKPMETHVRQGELVFYIALFVVVIVGIAIYYWQNKIVIELMYNNIEGGQDAMTEDQGCVQIKPSSGIKLKVGNILSYITIPFFPLSRILQIVQNARTKRTENLSITMFILNSVGNLSQTISLIIDSVLYNRIKEQIAYICNTFLPLVLDIVILIQSIYYNKHKQPQQEQQNVEQLVIASDQQKEDKQEKEQDSTSKNLLSTQSPATEQQIIQTNQSEVEQVNVQQEQQIQDVQSIDHEQKDSQ